MQHPQLIKPPLGAASSGVLPTLQTLLHLSKMRDLTSMKELKQSQSLSSGSETIADYRS